MKRILVAGTTATLLTGGILGYRLGSNYAEADSRFHARVRPSGRRSPAAVSNSLLVSDKGSFRVLLNGNEVGTEQFETTASGNVWIARGESVTRVPGEPETRSSGELRISADGTPLGYKWAAQAEKKASGVVEFSDGMAKTGIVLSPSATTTRAVSPSAAAQAVTVNSTASIAVGNDLMVGTGDSQEMVTVTAMTQTSFTAIFGKSHGANTPVSKPLEQDFMFPSPRVAILDNNLYSQYALVALLYDWNAKGQQTLPVLIPQDMTPGAITVGR